MGLGTFAFGVIVLILLFLLVVRGSLKLNIGLKHNMYFFLIGVLSHVLVIITEKKILQ